MGNPIAKEATANYHRDLANLEALVAQLKQIKDPELIAALVQRGNIILTLMALNAPLMTASDEETGG